jgi:two-component system, cell cycle response regulator
MKILIVDDSQACLALARARLEQDGLDVVCADGGQAGLDTARREKPDLILLDMDMPDLSGVEVCRALKADRDLCMTPVVFLTAMEDTQQKVAALDSGAVDYITKPFDAFELRARVRAALRTKRLQDLLIEHARIDPLTELPNRRGLMQRLQEAWSRMQRHGGVVSLIMADIDHFKKVNDHYGHSAGDELLRKIAASIAHECRETDFPGRYGGEEFLVVVPDEEAATAAILAERCRQRIENLRICVGESSVGATASFGVADSRVASSPEDLIELADQSLYGAKEAGRNGVTITPLAGAAGTAGGRKIAQ